jgi:hypothetical protein
VTALAGEALLSGPETARGRLQRLALAYLHEKQDRGEIPTSIRFVFYELEQRGEQTKATGGARKPAQNLTDAITWLRDVGLIPWDWIVDDSRRLHDWNRAATVMDYVEGLLDSATLDPWFDAVRPVIISEAKTVGGVLARGLAQRYVVAVASTTGQCRGFLETEVAPLLRYPNTRVLYIGDADDAGDDIEANTRRVLERATGRTFDSGPWERLAITADQVAELRRQGVQPIVKTDRRYRDGNPHEAFEAEALGQSEIERIVRTRLDQLLPEPLADVLERKDEQREAIREALDQIAGETE